MVGPLKKLKRDPNGKGRGPGLYYHRGNGYFSKYKYSRDRRNIRPLKKAKGKKPASYRHTRDTKSVNRRGKKVPINKASGRI